MGAALKELREAGVRRVLVLPLYPQYSTTTTASVADVLARDHGLSVRMIDDYHVDAGWIAAIAASIRAHWQANGRGEHLLLSFHGIPQRLVDAGDPYARQCAASAAAIASALELVESDWTLGYQSRFGRGCNQPPPTSSMRWRHAGYACSMSPFRVSRSIAWRLWRRFRCSWPNACRRAAARCATSHASTRRPRTPRHWRHWRNAKCRYGDARIRHA